MKRISLLSLSAIIAILCSMQSCTKIGSLLQYDIPMQSGNITITIPPTENSITALTAGGTNTINIDSIIKAHTAGMLGINNITSVKLTSAAMTLQNADANNSFANFQSCFVSFTSNSDNAPYQISINDNPNVFTASIELPVDTTAELKNYISGSNFSYTTGGQLRAATTKSLTCTITFTFNLHVQG